MLFDDSLLYNIQYGDFSASRERVLEAAEQVGLTWLGLGLGFRLGFGFGLGLGLGFGLGLGLGLGLEP